MQFRLTNEVLLWYRDTAMVSKGPLAICDPVSVKSRLKSHYLTLRFGASKFDFNDYLTQSILKISRLYFH